jgi:hypothetical protein
MIQMNEELLKIEEIVVQPLSAMLSKLIAYIPNLIGAIVILFIGFIIAKIVEIIAKKISKKLGVNKLSKQSGMDEKLQESNIAKDFPEIFGKILFWFVMFMFFMSASDTLGLDVVSRTLRTIMLYIPNILASILILLFGLFIANITKKSIKKKNSAIPSMVMAANLIYMIINVVTISLAINQLEIETELLNQVVSIVLISMGVALALSLGLGTRDVASDIISGAYVKEIYSVGDVISFNEQKGIIKQLGNIKTIIHIQQNNEIQEISIPNTQMIKQTITKII